MTGPAVAGGSGDGSAQELAASSGRLMTFLFTDIEGSTSLWERYPSLMIL
jgi:class 3 adenylate cyclase